MQCAAVAASYYIAKRNIREFVYLANNHGVATSELVRSEPYFWSVMNLVCEHAIPTHTPHQKPEMTPARTSIPVYCFLVQNDVITGENIEKTLEMLRDRLRTPELFFTKAHFVFPRSHDSEKLESLIAFEESYFCYVLSKAIADYNNEKSSTTFTKLQIRAQLLDRMQLSPLYQFVRAEITSCLSPRASLSMINKWVRIIYEATVDVQNELLEREFRPPGKGFAHVFQEIYKLEAHGGMFISILENSTFRKQLKGSIRSSQYLFILLSNSFGRKYDKDQVLAEKLVVETVSEVRTKSVFVRIRGSCRFFFFPWKKGIHETVTTIERMSGLCCPGLVDYKGFVVTPTGIEVATEPAKSALESGAKVPPGFFAEVGKLLSSLLVRLHSEGMRLRSLGSENIVYTAQKKLKILVVKEVEVSDGPIDWSVLSKFLEQLAHQYVIDVHLSLEKFLNGDSSE